jgi:hypothetical protein
VSSPFPVHLYHLSAWLYLYQTLISVSLSAAIYGGMGKTSDRRPSMLPHPRLLDLLGLSSGNALREQLLENWLIVLGIQDEFSTSNSTPSDDA